MPFLMNMIIDEPFQSLKDNFATRASQLDMESSLDYEDNNDTYSMARPRNGENKILNLIDEFFSISYTLEREIQMINIIKQAYRRYRSRKGIRKLHKTVFKLLNYPCECEDLPSDLHLFILTFLPKSDLYKISQLSKYFHELSFHQSLWGTFKLSNQKKNCQIAKYLPQLMLKWDNIRVLDFSFCMSIDEQSIAKIVPYMNKGVLKELYLDGWEKVNDNALSVLTGRDLNFLSVELRGFKPDIMLDSLPPLWNQKPKGIELLSLNECRNLHWSGIMKLDKMQDLKTLNLLGWVNVKDEGIISLNKTNDNLETLNLSGTSITSEWIYFIIREAAIWLKNVNIVGCKKLKNSDQDILKSHGFNVLCGEDTFRFNLLPEPFYGLRKITQSVLKTRSTLSIFRVYKYLAKRLINDMNIFSPEVTENHLDHDEFINSLNLEIHCQGFTLEPQLQLKDVHTMYWNNNEELLTLYYRNKEPKVKPQSEIISMSTKPPVWVPDYISYSCNQWDKDFSVFWRIHHWRACGKWFCQKWSRWKISLPQYGYNEAVRVCSDWYGVNSTSEYHELIENLSHRNTNSIIYEAVAEL